MPIKPPGEVCAVAQSIPLDKVLLIDHLYAEIVQVGWDAPIRKAYMMRAIQSQSDAPIAYIQATFDYLEKGKTLQSVRL